MIANLRASVSAASEQAGNPLPRAWALGLARGGIELKMFFRERDAVAFGFSFPIVMLLMFGSIFHSGYRQIPGLTVSMVYTSGLMGAGLMVASFQNLGARITMDREDGTLKRLRGTPMPASSYFIGKILCIAVVSAIEVLSMLILGILLFHLPVPAAGQWLTLLWVFALGLTASSLLGIAVTSIVPSARTSHMVISGPLILLQFISGVFVPFNELPRWLYNASGIFPLRWISQGFRGAVLPGQAARLDPSGSFHLGQAALALAAWTVIGSILVAATFRWRQRGES
ncbi:MAG: ABC transporter permease [Actinobacteria bacterium]|nr:ABC transporter permease [Actinomycetota bacterium]